MAQPAYGAARFTSPFLTLFSLIRAEIELPLHPFQVPQQLAAERERRPEGRRRPLRLRDLLLPAEGAPHAAQSLR